MSRLSDFPNDPRLQGKILDAKHAHTSQRIARGVMGLVLGVGKEKPGNVTGFAIIVACTMILALGFLNLHQDVPKRELIMLIAGVIPGALGYYFGYLTGVRTED
jgi:hypothetical protein